MLVMLRLTIAFVFAVIGIAGFLLPILPGWLFIVLAVLVAFPRSAVTRRILDLAEPKLPRFTAWLRKNGVGIVRARDTTRDE